MLSILYVLATSNNHTLHHPSVSQPMHILPVLTDCHVEEKRICELQLSFATRLRQSAYYVTEPTKSNGMHYRECRVAGISESLQQSWNDTLTGIGRQWSLDHILNAKTCIDLSFLRRCLIIILILERREEVRSV